MISFKCPACKKPIQLEDGSPGQEIRCIWCGQRTAIPSRLYLLLRNPRRLFATLVYVSLAAGLMLVSLWLAIRRR